MPSHRSVALVMRVRAPEEAVHDLEDSSTGSLVLCRLVPAPAGPVLGRLGADDDILAGPRVQLPEQQQRLRPITATGLSLKMHAHQDKAAAAQ